MSVAPFFKVHSFLGALMHSQRRLQIHIAADGSQVRQNVQHWSIILMIVTGLT